jgi:hypothetical protein
MTTVVVVPFLTEEILEVPVDAVGGGTVMMTVAGTLEVVDMELVPLLVVVETVLLSVMLPVNVPMDTRGKVGGHIIGIWYNEPVEVPGGPEVGFVVVVTERRNVRGRGQLRERTHIGRTLTADIPSTCSGHPVYRNYANIGWIR